MPQPFDPYYAFQPRPEPASPPPKVDYLLGVDLAQARDFTAIAAIERIGRADGTTFNVRHLERFQDRPYTDIARHIRGLVEALRTPRKNRDVTVIVDGTGVGAAALDVMRETEIDAALISVLIHGGDRVSGDERAGFRVPKRDLVSAVAVAMQDKRLRIRPTMRLASVLTDELGQFKAKINLATGHDSYEAWRDRAHDDTVLAVALPVWFSDRPKDADWTDVPTDLVAAWLAS